MGSELWIGLFWLRIGSVAGCCKDGGEFSVQQNREISCVVVGVLHSRK
jgi:hypothetical protein